MSTYTKTFILVNASLAVSFGIFIELAKWCGEYGVSPYLSIPGTMAVCGSLYWFLIRAVSRRFG
jgi:hypothetical protein